MKKFKNDKMTSSSSSMSSGSTFRKLTETELERQPEEVFDLVEEIGKARMGLTFVDFLIEEVFNEDWKSSKA